MKKKNNGIFYVVISLVSVLAICSIGFAYSGYGTPKNVIEGDYIEAAQPAGEVTIVDESLGAISGPESSSPYFTFNNVTEWFASDGVNIASTTLCSLKSPTATSTLVFASFQIKTATGTAIYLEIGKGATYNATTTSLGITSIASGAKATVLASTTPVAFVDDRQVFAPNQYLVFKGSSAIGAFASGSAATCKAKWMEN